MYILLFKKKLSFTLQVAIGSLIRGGVEKLPDFGVENFIRYY